MKRTPLRRRSKKLEKEMKLYRKEREEFLAGRRCELCNREATDVHHKRGRVGKALRDQEFWMRVCRPCHTKIEENRAWAYDKGYLIKRR